MTSRKQKIKSKREQEEKEIRQVRMAVAVVASLVVVGIIAYIVVQSGLLEPPPKEFVPYPETSGTPTQICNQHTPVEGSGRNNQFSEQLTPIGRCIGNIGTGDVSSITVAAGTSINQEGTA